MNLNPVTFIFHAAAAAVGSLVNDGGQKLAMVAYDKIANQPAPQPTSVVAHAPGATNPVTPAFQAAIEQSAAQQSQVVAPVDSTTRFSLAELQAVQALMPVSTTPPPTVPVTPTP